MRRTKTVAEDTKSRIIDATIETLKLEGITGTSARAIARTGGFNQALIFYHFGSIDEVLVATIELTSEQRIARYRKRLQGITSPGDLAEVAADLHSEDMEAGNLTVLTQLMAGAAGDPELGKRLRTAFDPWIEVVAEALGTALTGSPFATMIPLEDAAMAVSALFLGIEQLTHLDPERAPTTLYTSLQLLAGLLEALIRNDDGGDGPRRNAPASASSDPLPLG